MAQWGAYGYAKHGVTYDKILAHYYPGTIARACAGRRRSRSCWSRARNGWSSRPRRRSASRTRQAQSASWRPASYAVDPTLGVVLNPARPAKKLPGPLTFVPGKSPLSLRNPYRGSFTVSSDGKNLTVVNTVALEAYIRGVVSSEMPHDWPLEAVKAQAVAARSYALAHRRGGAFDVYNDTRDQVYGGIAAETPVGDKAVAGTSRQVLLYDGQGREHVLLLELGRADGRRHRRLHRREADAVPGLGPRPLGHLLAVPQLGARGGRGAPRPPSCSASRAPTRSSRCPRAVTRSRSSSPGATATSPCPRRTSGVRSGFARRG